MTSIPSPDYDWQTKINDSVEVGTRDGLYGTWPFVADTDGYGHEAAQGSDPLDPGYYG